MKPIRIGLIGLGRMGLNHLRVLSMLKDVDLSFVYDIDKTTSARFSEEYNVPFSKDIRMDSKKVDALIIATPTTTHFDYVKQAKDDVAFMFIEKPLAENLQRSEEILKLARENSIKTQTGFIERFNSAVIALQQILEQSNRVINIDFTRTNKLSSRITDVDVIMDLMIHDIDLALFLNGPVCDVSSYGIMENGLVSFARAVLKHENGVFSSLTASRITEKKIRQITVTCDDMFVDCNLLRKEIMINKQSVIEQYIDNLAITSKEESVGVNPQEALLSEHLAFIKLCRGEVDKHLPTAEDGLNAIVIADNIQKQIVGETE